MKESSTLKSLFAKDRGMPKGANYPAKFEKTAFEKGKKFKNLFKGLTVSGVASKLPKAAKNLGKVATVGKIARAATPIGLAATATKIAYDVATMSPEKKAKVKKLKKELSKKSTKQQHADLLKANLGLLAMKKARQKGAGALELLSPLAMAKKFFNTGGTMLKGGQKKLDKNKDGKISGEDFKLMKKNMGGEMRGYGAARKSGMGLQDEQLVPGKSLDYYKDLM